MDDKIKTYSPYLLSAYHISKRRNKYNRKTLNPRKTFWLIKSHQTSSLFPPWKRWARHGSKDRKYPICKLNSRLFSHRVTYNENLVPADETLQPCPLPLPKLVVLLPIITGLASSGGREKTFALNLPALKSFKSAFPTSLHLRCFHLGVVRGGVVTLWQVFGFHKCARGHCGAPRHIFEEFWVIYSCSRWQAILMAFFPMSVMEKYCQKEGTVWAPNTSRVHVGLYECMLLGREPCTNPPPRDVFHLCHSQRSLRGDSRGDSSGGQQPNARCWSGTEQEPWMYDLSFILTIALWCVFLFILS